MDMDTMEIEDGCWIAVYILAAAACFTMPETSLISRLIGIVCVSVPMLLLTLAIPGAFGGGDMKLMGACGAFLEVEDHTDIHSAGCIGRWNMGIWLLIGKKKDRKDHFAFGPFLCMGMAVEFCMGNRLFPGILDF